MIIEGFKGSRIQGFKGNAIKEQMGYPWTRFPQWMKNLKR